MKKSILTLIFTCIFHVFLFAQSDQKEITKAFDNYAQAIIQKDFNKVTDYLHPDVFNYFTREKMIEGLRLLMDDPVTRLEFSKGKVINISKIIEVKKQKYAVVKYSFTVTSIVGEIDDKLDDDVIIIDDSHEPKEEDKEEGEKVISTNQMDAELYAIKDPKFEGWKFVRKTEFVNEMVKEIISPKVLKKLK